MALPYPSPRMRCMLATGRRGGHDGQTCRRCCLPTYLPTGGTRWTASVTAAAAAAQGNGAGTSERETKRPTFRAGWKPCQPASPAIRQRAAGLCTEYERKQALSSAGFPLHSPSLRSSPWPFQRRLNRKETPRGIRSISPGSSSKFPWWVVQKRMPPHHHNTVLPPSLPPDQTDPTGNDPPFCRRL